MSANANAISPTRGGLPGLSNERLPFSSPSTVAETPTHEDGQTPVKIVTHWRRFSSGLWRVPEGDISAANSAESFPKIKVFTHEGKLFTNGGGHFSGPVAAGADCYLLIPANDYCGPEPRRYTYEGREACCPHLVPQFLVQIAKPFCSGTTDPLIFRDGGCVLHLGRRSWIIRASLDQEPLIPIPEANQIPFSVQFLSF